LLPQAESLLRAAAVEQPVVVGSVDALLLLVQDGAPLLYRAFEPLRPHARDSRRSHAAQRIYSNL